MTKEEENEVHRLVQSVGVVQLSRVMFKDMDVSEMINVIILAGRGYSIKLLTWFKYYCEVMPLFIISLTSMSLNITLDNCTTPTD